ncbi:phosphoglycolate phosphatase [Arthrobacter sp. V1I7]|uniref:HAD hydrolase-like protein n=1 Tax=Arthrobacter sp. V1I7 TaxID=3042274 RepID=UPI002781A6B9|nr:HAD hydrolase-like protein [Arthrobacter sp. V1I7]MDQ0821139.1 phosphoglycolate phosphatase [Arthrobacter sp. V1I7]
MTQTTVPVIFDLDGTLVDPAGGITDGIAAALTELGLPVPGKARMDAMIGPKLSHSLTEIAGVPADQLQAAIRIYRAHYVSTGIAQSRLYPGVRDLLESFAAAGRPVAVATQKPEGLARTVLEHHGIADHFGTIRGSAADEAAEADAAAPAGKTGIVAAALADLEAQSAGELRQAVMVGDRAQDVAGAAANGLECIGVGWGFALDGELDEAGAVEIVQTTTALHETILRRDAAGTVAGLTPARAAAAMAYVARTEARTEVYTDANV